MTTPKLDLDEAERLSKLATPGPWAADDSFERECGQPCTPNGCGGHDDGGAFLIGAEYEYWQDQPIWIKREDASFIAFARTFIPLAVERLRELEGAIRADDERLEQAALRIGEHGWGCDTPEHMADTILELRARIAELERQAGEMKKENNGYKELVRLAKEFTERQGFDMTEKDEDIAILHARVAELEAQAEEDEAAFRSLSAGAGLGLSVTDVCEERLAARERKGE